MAGANLQVVIQARDEASSVFGKIAQGAGGLTHALGAIGMASLGIEAIGASLQGLLADSIDAQQVQAQLNSVLTSTHGAAGMSAKAVNDLADSLSRVTPFEDETVGKAENMLLTFTNIGQKVFPQATEAVLNMAQALGEDTQSAAIQLGKALNDPIKGVTALQRVGVSLNDTQQEQVAAMMKVNNIAGAQAIILKELGTEFGGAARAAGETFAGKLSILNTQIGNVKESIGGALLPILSSLVDRITALIPRVLEFADYIGGTFGPYIQAGIEMAGEAFDALASIVSSSLGSVWQTVVSIGQAIYEALSWLNPFAEHSPSLVSEVVRGMALIRLQYETAPSIAHPLQTAGRAIKVFSADSTAVLAAMATAAKGSLDDMKSALSDATDALHGFQNAPLEGQGALDDQKFALEQQQNQIRLQMEQGKAAGKSDKDLQGLQDQLDALGHQASILDLQGKLKFDPLERQIKQMTNTTKEMSFDQIVQGIKNSQAAIAILTPAIKASEEALKAHNAAMKGAAGAGGGGGKGGKGGGGAGGLGDALAHMKELSLSAGTGIADFKKKVDDARESLTKIGKSVGDFLTPFRQFFETIKTSSLQDFANDLYKILTFSLGAKLLAWIAERAPEIKNQLNLWGQAFIDWIGPMTTKFLAAWPGMLKQFLDWIETSADPILSHLDQWANAFVDWIEPNIPKIILAMAKINLAILEFIGLTTEILIKRLIKWALAFVEWVGPMIPQLIVELTKINIEILKWIAQQALDLGPKMLNLGEDMIKQFVRGLLNVQIPSLNSIIGGAPGAINSAASTLSGGVIGGNSNVTNVHIYGNNPNPSDVQSAATDGVLAAQRSMGY